MRLKLVPAAMCLERRRLGDIAQNHADKLHCCHVFTDGSPVTGVETQGMLLQLAFANGLVDTLVSPGVALRFGVAETMDKAVAILWALLLVIGPCEETHRFLMAQYIA